MGLFLAYLLGEQGPGQKPAKIVNLAPYINADYVHISFKHKVEGDPDLKFLPKSSWTEGRNYLFELVKGNFTVNILFFVFALYNYQYIQKKNEKMATDMSI